MTKTEIKRLKSARAEVVKRGGEIEIEGRYNTEIIKQLDMARSGRRKVYLYGCNGWRQYSKAFGARQASLRYLYGTDDSGKWAVRVPGTIESVTEGLEWLEPALVKRVRERGKRVFRQGNLYLVETTKKAADTERDWQNGEHMYFARARVLLHNEHRPLVVPTGHFRAVEQNSLDTNRGRSLD